ncbi:MAG: DNA polymerase III subunit alpha [Phycisphaeraceae bacterium]|nr:DNA polymerase III subunit alpha [Phycisphaeraceae bacterium]
MAAGEMEHASAAGAEDARAVGRFAHLHLHTEYSLLDGGNRISKLIERVKALGMDAVAITDHGNLHGCMELHEKARKAGIRPILGIEAYVAIGDRRERRQTGIADGGFHLVLLAETMTGWRHLLRISSDAFLNGFYYKPRTDRSMLERWSEGLIAINGHLGSSIAHHLLQFVQTGNPLHRAAAVEEARWHAATFRPNGRGEPRFYIELQRHGVREQHDINPHLVALARELDLPIVCDNDAHFLRREDHDAHDSLCCISMGRIKTDPGRLRYDTELFVKSPEEMEALFHDLPEAVENAARIAARCDVDLGGKESHAPVVRIVSDLPDLPEDAAALASMVRAFESGDPVGSTEWYNAFCAKFRLEPFDAERDVDSADDLKRRGDQALRALAEAGAIWRYGTEPLSPSMRARLDRELRILADKSISAYFLIVWDFVSWARANGIPATARGSGVGTMVGYVLGLSNACPERYGLLFERFTDPDRSEYPDIDIDICQEGRARVIDYVRQKYGYVAQIITFGRLKAKAAIKDVARVMGLLPAEGQRLSNLVPKELNITLDEALEKDPDFREEYEGNEASRAVIDTARALEDHARSAGVHAAGVVIATQPLENIVPLCRATGGDDIVTQWDGPTCESVGLLKMDFLGLRTLTTIEMALRFIREGLAEDAIWRATGRADGLRRPEHERGPHPLMLDRIPFDDQQVLALFRRADTAGVFQFESEGMRKLLLDMQPDRLEDLIAANALFRPGPMDLIPEYCQRKHGRQQVPKIHPIVDAITAETYGIMVYQEQVMQIAHQLGDIPLRAAYTLIKAISKKKESVIDAERPKFIEGAARRGLSRTAAEELFSLILRFAGYGFNKSHSTGYAIIAYQTAYLKTYFPAQYMAAVMTLESGARKIEEWSMYLDECSRLVWPDHAPDAPHIGIEVRSPDITRSGAGFVVVYGEDEPHDALHGHIRFGLGAVKGVGRAAVHGILEERMRGGPFRSIWDFCDRVPQRVANKAVIEALVRAGAFDTLHGGSAQRSRIFAAIDDAMAAGQSAAADRSSGQLSMFGLLEEARPDIVPADPPLPMVPAWERRVLLDGEKQTLGFYLSGHPLDEHFDLLRPYLTCDARRADDEPDQKAVVLGGVLTDVRIITAKSGRSAGEKMAVIRVQDHRGTIECVVFANVFQRDAARIVPDAVVLVIGRVDHSRGATQIIVEQVLQPREAPMHLSRQIEISLVEDADGAGLESSMRLVRGILQQAGGQPAYGGRPAEVRLALFTRGKRIGMRVPEPKVIPDPRLLERLQSVVGPGRVRVLGGLAAEQLVAPQGRGGNGGGRRHQR